MTKEIVKTENSPVVQAIEFLKNGGDLANLEKMMELQERWEANQAKKAFNDAMTAFKANPPKLKKTKKVAFKETKYSHADLAEITEEISAELSKHDLNATWKTSQENQQISVTCIIAHSLGYSESTTLSSAPDSSGGKNSIQAIGSTITYLQRYTLLALTGLAAHDQDDDGKGAEPKEKPELTPESQNWEYAKKAYMRDGKLDIVLSKSKVSEENQKLIFYQCAKENYQAYGDFSAMDGFEGLTEDMQLKIIQELAK